MIAQSIASGLYCIPCGAVNTFLIEGPDGCLLVDAGFPESAPTLLRAFAELGKKPEHILLTHGHPDHIGSAAALKSATGAEIWIHPRDRRIAEAGRGFRPMAPAPGILNKVLCKFFLKPDAVVEPVQVDHEFADGQEVFGLRVVHVPGHCEGQVALFWPQAGALFAADACANMVGLGLSIAYEDLEQGRRDLRKLAAMQFEIACFGHGKPIVGQASDRFRKKFVQL